MALPKCALTRSFPTGTPSVNKPHRYVTWKTFGHIVKGFVPYTEQNLSE